MEKYEIERKKERKTGLRQMKAQFTFQKMLRFSRDEKSKENVWPNLLALFILVNTAILTPL